MNVNENFYTCAGINFTTPLKGGVLFFFRSQRIIPITLNMSL